MANIDVTIFSYIYENAGNRQPLENKMIRNAKYLPALFDICHKMLSDFKFNTNKIFSLQKHQMFLIVLKKIHCLNNLK